jgi:tRNA pseudouridine38-40 synthase
MVRSIVGVLIGVGTGRRDAGEPDRLLRAGRRTEQLHVAPAHGLTLMAVDYPPDVELAARAGRTRAIRGRDRTG